MRLASKLNKGRTIRQAAEDTSLIAALVTLLSVTLLIIMLIVLSLSGIASREPFQVTLLSVLVVVSLFLVILILITLRLSLRRNETLEAASTAKDSFIANVSHEIKTPINAIVGMLHLLKETGLSEQQSDLAKKIEQSSDLLLHLINDILDFSKIKAGTISFYPQAVRLAEILDDVEAMFMPLAASKGLRWITELEFDSTLCICIDKIRLTQVLMNLISNSLKFTDTGHIRLTVRMQAENKSGVELFFSLEDTGIGVNEADTEILFREFIQLENHLTKQHQGTGLGLALSQYIVSHMGGRLQLYSSPTGKTGTTFYFTIHVPKAEPLPEKDAVCRAKTQILQGRGQKVLVAEDTEINYEVVRRLLMEVDIDCDHACDGLAAIEMCKQHPSAYYRVILMDVHMPNLDGYSAARILREQLHVTTPILALTATNVSSGTISKYEDLLDGYILKPFKPAQLYEALIPYFSCSGLCCERYEAIENLGGNEDLYERHLQKFFMNYHNSPAQILESLQAGDIAEAHRLTHSIKGLAATLGITCLQKTAAELETILLTDPQNPDAFILLKTMSANLLQSRCATLP